MLKNKALLIGVAVAAVVAGIMAFRYFGTTDKQTVQATKEQHREEKHKEGKDEHDHDEKVIMLHDEDIKEFGIEVKEAGPGTLTVPLELPGEIVANPDRLAHIVPRAPGVVRKVMKNLGDVVKAGETLAVLDSRDLADSKAAYLAALKRVEIAKTILKREEQLWKKKISPEMDYLGAQKTLAEADIELKSAEKKLHVLGLSDDDVEKLPTQPDVAYTQYEIRAPFSGTVIGKHIALGELVKDDRDVFIVADLSTVWVNIQVYQKDMLSVRKGQQVVISTGKSVPDVTGAISFIEPVAGAETRTAVAHVVLPNPKGILRPGLFVTAKVTLDEIPVPILIPKTAIITEGGKISVFVEEDEGFKLQPITTGRGNDSAAEVVSGLKAGKKYVSKGGFTLKAQMSKGAFGDGHAH